MLVRFSTRQDKKIILGNPLSLLRLTATVLSSQFLREGTKLSFKEVAAAETALRWPWKAEMAALETVDTLADLTLSNETVS